MDAGLWIDYESLNLLFEASSMRPGKEHRVAYVAEDDCVIKVAAAQALATESVFDYLTDLLFSNFYFEDDLQLLGGYEKNGRLYIVTQQPYVSGSHPDWDCLKVGLVQQGLRNPHPLSNSGSFIIDDEKVGEVDVYDLHCNNVIQTDHGVMQPIDAHFYFDDRTARIAALQSLGLDRVAGPTDLTIRLEDNESGFF